ncbi:hypothetical protein YTPLAS73_09150 [Nitrosarchaeum sp.]|nr:hypothetical protein YTPLAS73_09150 [Nitrosarchaeum sp.]
MGVEDRFLSEIYAKLIPLSQEIRDRNQHFKTRLTEKQEKHVDIITEELSILSQDLGVDMVIYAIKPEI